MKTNVRKVHVIFKTHLDIGFTDYASNVISTYLDSFIPRAIELAYQANEGKDKPAFLWMTGSWLIYEYLRIQPEGKIREIEEAIGKGLLPGTHFLSPHIRS